MSDTLSEVQDYYDRLAPRLYAVEERNWHLQSRISLVLETIDRFAPPRSRVLDIGCGTGFLLEHMARREFSGVGVDLSPESVEVAQARLVELNAADRLRAEVGSAYEPPDGPFDLITVTDVLEHLEDPRRCLTAARSPAPGGLVVVSTPNRRSLHGARRWMSWSASRESNCRLPRSTTGKHGATLKHTRRSRTRSRDTPRDFSGPVDASGRKFVASTASTLPRRLELAVHAHRWASSA